jgi:PAS domain S-box-containing protein
MNTALERTAAPAALALGLLVSAWLAWQLHQSNRSARHELTVQLAQQVTDRSVMQLERVSMGLRGARGYLLGAGLDRADAAGFKAYMATRDPAREFPGMEGLGVIRRVKTGKEAAFLAQVRTWQPGFQLRSLDAPGEERRIVQFVEPAASNAAAIGLDIATEGLRRQASDQALRTDDSVLSAPIRLVQSQPGSSLGLLMMLRLAPSQRPAGLGIGLEPAGFVYAAIQLDRLLAAADLHADLVRVDVQDETPGDPVRDYALGAQDPGIDPLAQQVSLVRAVMGRTWRFTVTPRPALAARLPARDPMVVVLFGSLFSLLLAQLAGFWARLRLQTREALDERIRLRTMLDHASDAIIGLDLEGRVRLWNHAAVRLFGHTELQALGQPLTALTLDAEHVQEDAMLRKKALAGEVIVPYETTRRHRDGTAVDVELSAGPMYDREGRATGVAKVLRPIRERLSEMRRLKAWGEALEAEVEERTRALDGSRRDLRAVLDAMPSMVGSWDRGLRNRFANNAYSSFFGRTPEQIQRMTLPELLGPELFEKNRPFVEQVLAGTEQLFERAIPLPDGSGFRHTLAHYLPQIVDAQVQGFYVLVHDVTPLKRAQEQLAETAARLHHILEGTGAATWEWHVPSGTTRFNERWAQIVGWTLQELSPCSIDTWTRLVHPDDLHQSADLLQRHFAGELDAYECEARMRHREGHWVWVLDRGRVRTRMPDGSPEWMFGTHLDITERKRIELALRESQSILQHAGAMAQVGGWTFEFATQELYWSDQTCRIHGLPPGHRPSLDEAISFYAPEAQVHIRALVERGVAEGRGWDTELPMVRADGRPIWVRAIGEVERLAGQAVRLVGAFQDITVQVEARQALQREQTTTHSMLAAAPVAVRVARLSDSRVTFVNEEFARLVRRPPEEARNIDITGHYVHREDVNDIRQRLNRGEIIRNRLVELQLPGRPDVPHVWALASYMRLDFGSDPSVLAWFFDVTELRAAREAARQSREIQAQALEATQAGLAIFDANDRLEMINQRMAEMYPLAASALHPGIDFETYARAITAAYRSDDDPQTSDWVRDRVARFREGGTWTKRLRDGRFIRAVERSLSDGHFVSLRTDVTELMRATEAAEAASRAKSEFLASTSHEIRTPLNAILGLTYLLERESLPDDALIQVRRIAQAGRSLLALVNDVLDLAKVEAGQLKLDVQIFDLHALVEGEVTLLTAARECNDLTTTVTIDPAVARVVQGDADRLRQILDNLLSNALKFTERGSVRLQVRRGTSAPWLVFELADSGIGIAPEVQARLFQPFEQADASTSRRFGGTGLGLAITARLVDLMGGRIELRSALGEGSTFTVTLPLPEAAGAEVHETSLHDQPLRVLLTEDDVLQREAMSLVARSLGWTCVSVPSGEAMIETAVQAAQSANPFDALIIDWQLPGIDGLEALAQLRSQLPREVWPAALVISQHERQHLRASRHAKLASAILTKPVDTSSLFNAINQSVAALPARRSRLLDVSLRHGEDLLWLDGAQLLVVDDSSLNLDVARRVLELEGAQVTTCDDGVSALACLLEGTTAFDAVLLDIQMPGMDGLEVARRIRQQTGWAGLPVIALSAGVLRDDQDSALAAGMNDFLSKPLDAKRLVACLRRHVEQYRGHPWPVLPRRKSAAMAHGTADLLGIDGIDERLIEPSLLIDPEVVPSMLRRLLDEFLDIGDLTMADLPARLHKLRGSARTVGADRVARAADRAEAVLRQVPLDPIASGREVQTLSARLRELDRSAEPSLQRWQLRREAATRAQALDMTHTHAPPLSEEQMQELRHTLERQSTRASARVEELARELHARIGPERLARLREALFEYDFAAAAASLDPAATEGGEVGASGG